MEGGPHGTWGDPQVIAFTFGATVVAALILMGLVTMAVSSIEVPALPAAPLEEWERPAPPPPPPPPPLCEEPTSGRPRVTPCRKSP